MLLAIDTSTHRCSVAVLDDGQSYSYPLDPTVKASMLAEVVVEVLKKHGTPTGYAIDIGPGSFTGLRVGLAFLKGLVRTKPGPVLALNSLEVLAADILAESPPDTVAVPVLKASGHYVFAAAYTASGETARPKIDAHFPIGLYEAARVPERVSGLTSFIRCGGEGLVSCPELQSYGLDGVEVPRATTLAKLAAPRLVRGEGTRASQLEPAYYQPSAAEAKKLAKSAGSVAAGI